MPPRSQPASATRSKGGQPRACSPPEMQGLVGASGGAGEAALCPSSWSTAWPRPARRLVHHSAVRCPHRPCLVAHSCWHLFPPGGGGPRPTWPCAPGPAENVCKNPQTVLLLRSVPPSASCASSVASGVPSGVFGPQHPALQATHRYARLLTALQCATSSAFPAGLPSSAWPSSSNQKYHGSQV